jgi:hypothetical protein
MKIKNIALILIVAAAFASCKKKDKDDDSPTNNPPASALAYWYCSLDGTPTNFSIVTGAEDCMTYYGNSSSVSGVGVDTSTFIYGGSIGVASANYPYFEIVRSTLILPDGGIPDNDQEKDFWKIPLLTYTPGALDDNGVKIVYFDAAGTEWSTANGPQTASTFTYTQITPSNQFGLHCDFKATFKCSLYNSAGQKKELTGGQCFIGFGTTQ